MSHRDSISRDKTQWEQGQRVSLCPLTRVIQFAMIKNVRVKFYANEIVTFSKFCWKDIGGRQKTNNQLHICVMIENLCVKFKAYIPFFIIGVAMKKVMKTDFITMVARQIGPPVHPFTHITPITVLAWDTITIKGRPLPKPIFGL